MSVLTHHEIEALVRDRKLIEHFSPHSLQGASYDMRLGPEYSREGVRKRLSESHPSIVLEPGDFVILSTLEYLNMPNDLVGHNGIMSPWAKRGIVSLFSPQIDPGFEGILVVPVFNAGDAKITISLEDRVFTVEFLQTVQPAAYGWAARFEPQTRIPDGATPSAVRANLSDIKEIQDTVTDLSAKLDTLTSRCADIEKGFEYQKGVRERQGFNIRKMGFYLALAAALGGSLTYLFGFEFITKIFNPPTN